MKKALALILALVMCFCLFAGCGDSKTPASNGGTTTSGAADNKGSDTKTDDGKVYELVVVNNDASTSMCELYVETLLNAMSEESGGRLKFVYYPGGSLYGATEAVDAVKDGAADICWSSVSFYGGRFPVTEYLGVCANGIVSSRMCAEVLMDALQNVPEVANEFKDFKVLMVAGSSVHPYSTVGKKLETPSDFKGLQIRCAGTVPSMYCNALGATAVSMSTNDVYESLSKGVIDGMDNDWHNIDCFKLYEAIDYCMDFTESVTPIFMLMNQSKYNELPDDLKAIVDKYSGYFASDMAGFYWDSCNYWVADKMKENGVEIYKPSEEMEAYLFSDEIVAQVMQTYKDYLGKTYSADEVEDIVARLDAIIAKYADAHANDWETGEFHYSDWDLSTVEGYNEAHAG